MAEISFSWCCETGKTSHFKEEEEDKKKPFQGKMAKKLRLALQIHLLYQVSVLHETFQEYKSCGMFLLILSMF